MKIVIPLLSLERHGGVRDIISIANYLSGKEYTVILVVPKGRIKPNYPIDEKVQVYKLPMNGESLLDMIRALIFYAFKLPKSDVYIANFFPTFFPLYLRSHMTNTKLLYFVQDIEYYFVRFPLNMTALFTYIMPSAKIALSRFIKERLRQKEIKVARAGVSEEFLTEPVKRNFKTLTVGHIYRKERMKNSILFLKALREISRIGVNTIIVGDTVKLKKIEGKNVRVIPYGDSTYLRDEFYDRIDIFVHTSNIEGFGLPPLEAMARGCVVLLTDSGGVREYAVQGDNALFIDKKNPHDLFEKIELLKDNKALMEKLSHKGRETAIRLPLSGMGREFLEAMNALAL